MYWRQRSRLRRGEPRQGPGSPVLPLPKSRQRELHFQFLQLVAAVELHQQKFRSQASVIDEIVDTAFEVNQEGQGQGKGRERSEGRRSYLKVVLSNRGMALAKAVPGSLTQLSLTLQAGEDDYGK